MRGRSDREQSPVQLSVASSRTVLQASYLHVVLTTGIWSLLTDAASATYQIFARSASGRNVLSPCLTSNVA
jgi:hypothetical protein